MHASEKNVDGHGLEMSWLIMENLLNFFVYQSSSKVQISLNFPYLPFAHYNLQF